MWAIVIVVLGVLVATAAGTLAGFVLALALTAKLISPHPIE